MEERMIDKEELLGRGAGSAGDGEDEDVYAAYAAGEDGYDEDLVGLDELDDADERAAVRHVSPVEIDGALLFHVAHPFVEVEVLDASGIE